MTAALAVSLADSPLTQADIAAGISTLLSALSAFRNASSDRQWPPSVQSIGAQTVIVQSLLANAPLTTAQTNANMQFLSDIMADVVTLFRSTESSSASAVGSRGSSVDTALFAGFVSAAAIGAGSGAGEAVSSGDAEVLSRSQLSAWSSISTAAIAISVIDRRPVAVNQRLWAGVYSSGGIRLKFDFSAVVGCFIEWFTCQSFVQRGISGRQLGQCIDCWHVACSFGEQHIGVANQPTKRNQFDASGSINNLEAICIWRPCWLLIAY